MKRSEPPGLNALVVLSVLAFLSVARDAEAYIDPGSGSVILQALIAAALGAWVAVKLGWKRVRGFARDFLRRKDKDAAEHSPD